MINSYKSSVSLAPEKWRLIAPQQRYCLLHLHSQLTNSSFPSPRSYRRKAKRQHRPETIAKRSPYWLPIRTNRNAFQSSRRERLFTGQRHLTVSRTLRQLDFNFKKFKRDFPTFLVWKILTSFSGKCGFTCAPLSDQSSPGYWVSKPRNNSLRTGGI